MNPVRVLVVDDQEVFRRVMSAVVQRTDGFVLAGCAASGEESIVTAGVLRPDLVLMDVVDGVSRPKRPNDLLVEARTPRTVPDRCHADRAKAMPPPAHSSLGLPASPHQRRLTEPGWG